MVASQSPQHARYMKCHLQAASQQEAVRPSTRRDCPVVPLTSPFAAGSNQPKSCTCTLNESSGSASAAGAVDSGSAPPFLTSLISTASALRESPVVPATSPFFAQPSQPYPAAWTRYATSYVDDMSPHKLDLYRLYGMRLPNGARQTPGIVRSLASRHPQRERLHESHPLRSLRLYLP